ncbi:MAG: M23 family metallopeptidase [Gorillibacterium sp.]|nr:M23 family metallopeptidase [Gorillibacterium sp.]
MVQLGCVSTAIILWFTFGPQFIQSVQADAAVPLKEKQLSETFSYPERRRIYDSLSILSGVAWYELAAVDQYHRTLQVIKKKTSPEMSGRYTEAEWGGLLNPNPGDTDERRIALFGGKGLDGSGDGIADRTQDADVVYSYIQDFLKTSHVNSWKDKLQTRFGPQGADRIEQFAKVYRTFDTLELGEHAFPLPLRANYTFHETWGASRGWGGRRMHEGTDIFAGYGVPARSTCYGIIEVKGWNNYGGWRIGIRDLNNVYHYYAHLSGFVKELKEGDVVKPGQTIGWVGSSGYGKPGTSGKFPPHLHFGLYRDASKSMWAFDPYPNLLRWEKEERKRLQKHRKP